MHEPLGIESIIVQLRIGSAKWCIITIYRSESVTSPDEFFSEFTKSLDEILSLYENVVFLGDININSFDKGSNKYNKLKNFCHSFDFKNLIKLPTCFQNIENPSSIDIILTNRNKSFMHSKSVTTGLSDHYSMIFTIFKATFVY